jgi:hypothetical protein
MTRETNAEANTISTSLSSIIRTRLIKREADVRLYQLNRPKAVGIIKELKSERWPDEKSIKAAKERLLLWDKEIRWFEVLVELADRIDGNPFPGQRLNLSDVATRLCPHMSKREWRQAFAWFGIDYHERVWFPVETNELDIDELEACLLGLILENGKLPACELETILQSTPNSKQYREVKRELQHRGWQWVNVKHSGITMRVINPP